MVDPRIQKDRIKAYMRKKGIEYPKCQIEGCNNEAQMYRPEGINPAEAYFICRSHITNLTVTKPIFDNDKTEIQEQFENIEPYDVREMEQSGKKLSYSMPYYRNKIEEILEENKIDIHKSECLADGCHEPAVIGIPNTQEPYHISAVCRSHRIKTNYDLETFDVQNPEELQKLKSRLNPLPEDRIKKMQQRKIMRAQRREKLQHEKKNEQDKTSPNIKGRENEVGEMREKKQQEKIEQEKIDEDRKEEQRRTNQRRKEERRKEIRREEDKERFPLLPNGKIDLSQMNLTEYTFQEIQQYPRGKYSSEKVEDPILKKQQQRMLDDMFEKEEQVLH